MEDAQQTITDKSVQDNINHWVSSITGTEKRKKKKEKHRHHDVVDVTEVASKQLDGCNDDESATDVTVKCGKKRSKSNQVVMEDSEIMVIEQKKKRKIKATLEEAPNDKRAKIQTDDETEKPFIKKSKKKKTTHD